jgi:hypothetical protein
MNLPPGQQAQQDEQQPDQRGGEEHPEVNQRSGNESSHGVRECKRCAAGDFTSGGSGRRVDKLPAARERQSPDVGAGHSPPARRRTSGCQRSP